MSFYQDKIDQMIDEKAKMIYRGRNRGRNEKSPLYDAGITGQTHSFIDAFEDDIDTDSKFVHCN